MVAYEFYWVDPRGEYDIIGVLPERRNKSERITQDSILNWGEKVFGKDLNPKDIFFIQVTIDDKTARVFRPIPFSIIYKRISG